MIDEQYDVVIPSMPGYAFSTYRTTSTINLSTIGDIYHVLMIKLGYERYFVQGTGLHRRFIHHAVSIGKH